MSSPTSAVSVASGEPSCRRRGETGSAACRPRASPLRRLPPRARHRRKALQPRLNIHPSDDDFVLAVSWLLACLRGRGPYPLMVIGGEQGTAKSTRSAILKSVIDPNAPSLRALPQQDRDLFIAAKNRHVLAFDNVSGLPTWVSDTLCRIASGVGFATRELYSDQDEDLFEGARPLILNGIEDIVDRPDLAERSLFFICGPIRDEDRRSEDELWAAFDASHPLILGALLDAVATGLKMLPNTRPLKLPRMADFAQWATACEPALWPSGAFRKAYYCNLEEAVESVLEADPIAVAVRAMLAARTGGDRLRSSRPFDRHRG